MWFRADDGILDGESSHSSRSKDLPYEMRDHAWFASFAGDGRRRLVAVVFVEHGGKGSTSAAPLAKLLYETYFQPDVGRSAS